MLLCMKEVLSRQGCSLFLIFFRDRLQVSAVVMPRGELLYTG